MNQIDEAQGIGIPNEEVAAKMNAKDIAAIRERLSDKHSQCLFTGLPDDEMRALNDCSALLADRDRLVEALKKVRLELVWCERQLDGLGYKSMEGGSVKTALEAARQALEDSNA